MDNQIKIITYNIDGLPEKLDLNDLPWILKPIAWIYKLFKKTTLITINDGCNKLDNIRKIGEYLEKENPDIIGVQEDFNYHNELVEKFYNKYSWGIYSGGFDLKHIFKSMTWFPIPRFKADGINLFGKVGKVHINIENIIHWNKSHGYVSHANDLLTHKGFRYYNLQVNDKYSVDVYVVHMDADFYHAENCPDVYGDIEARKSQFNQLVDVILMNYNNGNINPVIIIGDTNSYDKYEWDKENIEIELLHPINHQKTLTIKEAIPDNYKDCDRIFYINNYMNPNYKLELVDCKFDLDIAQQALSDHLPLIATFNIIDLN